MPRFRRALVLTATVLLSLLSASRAEAKRVHSLVPWAPTNTYVAKADIDGRSKPQLEPRAFINAVRKGQWVRITCQVQGQVAYGSPLWDKVGAYYVPDQLLKTYTDGALPGAPTCGAATPPPAPRCQRYTIYGLRGSGESSKGNHGMGATVGPAADAVKVKLGGRSVLLKGIPYPAVSVETLIQDPQKFQLSMQVGEILLRRAITRRIKDCPGSKIAVIGYSQGAGVASETMRSLPTSAFRHVRVAALFADTYSAGQTKYSLNFDYFNPNRSTPVRRQGHGVFGAKRLPAALPYKLDVCFADDVVCDMSKSTGGAVAQAFLAGMHSHYKDWAPGFFSSLPGFVGLLVGGSLQR